MYEFTFRSEPFSAKTCGCAECSGRGSRFQTRSLYAELDEPEWDVTPERERCTNVPAEVEECTSLKAVPAKQCLPSANKTCPALPEVWRSHKILGVPFYYEPTIKPVSSVAHRCTVTARGSAYKVELIPLAWMAAANWIQMMTVFGMPVSEVLTAGAGRYCRCVRQPKGVCKEARSTWDKCTGTTVSDHGYGDALDIIGIKWKDKTAVGSSLDYTVIHSWEDAAEQAPILIRMNAILRLSFQTVLDYSRSDHRNHFHCDMNNRLGRPRKVWEESPCEPNFIITALRRLGYLPKRQAVSWPHAKSGLAKFAAKVGAPLPANLDDKAQWRPLVSRLFGCVALSNPASCHA